MNEFFRNNTTKLCIMSPKALPIFPDITHRQGPSLGSPFLYFWTTILEDPNSHLVKK